MLHSSRFRAAKQFIVDEVRNLSNTDLSQVVQLSQTRFRCLADSPKPRQLVLKWIQ
jgi:hypothetical protein